MRFLALTGLFVVSLVFFGSTSSGLAATPPPTYGTFATQGECIDNALTLGYTDALTALEDDCDSSALADTIRDRLDRLTDINDTYESGFNNTVLENMALTISDSEIDDFEANQRLACIDRAYAMDYNDALAYLTGTCDAAAIADDIADRFDRLVGINNDYEGGFTTAQLQNMALTLTDDEIDEFEADQSIAYDDAVADAADDISETAPDDTYDVGEGLGLDHLDEENTACPDPVAGFDIDAIVLEVQSACSITGCPAPDVIRNLVVSAMANARADAIAMCTTIDMNAVLADAVADATASVP